MLHPIIKSPLIQELESAGHTTWALKLGTCGNPVRVVKCAQCGWEARPTVFHCKLRICRSCAKERTNTLREKYLDCIQSMKNPALWTLTLVDSDDLVGDVDRIREAFAKLRRRKPFRYAIRSGLYAIEVTPGKTKRFRVHLHALLDAHYVSQAALSKVWKELTNDSFVVDVRRVRDKRKALHYVLSYITKQVDPKTAAQPIRFLISVLERLEGKHLVQVLGDLWGAIKEQAKAAFCCPKCSADLWMVLDFLTREILFDPVVILQHRAARAGPK